MKYSPERIKHLEFLQATIARQASHSFAIKGWSLTVSAAIYAYAAVNLAPWMSFVALLPPAAFAYLDAYYLRQERLFRNLYNALTSGTKVKLFDMDTRPYANKVEFPNSRYWGRIGILRSSTWFYFHGVILAVGLVLVGVAIFEVLTPAVRAKCIG